MQNLDSIESEIAGIESLKSKIELKTPRIILYHSNSILSLLYDINMRLTNIRVAGRYDRDMLWLI